MKRRFDPAVQHEGDEEHPDQAERGPGQVSHLGPAGNDEEEAEEQNEGKSIERGTLPRAGRIDGAPGPRPKPPGHEEGNRNHHESEDRGSRLETGGQALSFDRAGEEEKRGQNKRMTKNRDPPGDGESEPVARHEGIMAGRGGELSVRLEVRSGKATRGRLTARVVTLGPRENVGLACLATRGAILPP